MTVAKWMSEMYGPYVEQSLRARPLLFAGRRPKGAPVKPAQPGRVSYRERQRRGRAARKG